MTKLIWDLNGSHLFEAGVDHGVLYLPDRSGVAWNGLTKVEEQPNGNTNTPLYFDGKKYLDLNVVSDYSGALGAITYPDEFLQFDGFMPDANGVPGLNLDNQAADIFHLSYRTKVGDELVGVKRGYKIHILYNLTAVSSDTNYQTHSATQTPITFAWTLSSKPELVTGYRHTAHVILDSTIIRPDILAMVEAVLYGSEDSDPYLPPLDDLITLVLGFDRLVITDNMDGTWTATGPDEYFAFVDADGFDLIADTLFPIRRLSVYSYIELADQIDAVYENVPTGMLLIVGNLDGVWETNGTDTLIQNTVFDGVATFGFAVDCEMSFEDTDDLQAFIDADESFNLGEKTFILKPGDSWTNVPSTHLLNMTLGIFDPILSTITHLATDNESDTFLVYSSVLD